MPRTSFTCRDKILGGYYADSETNCQMFHICVKVAGVGVSILFSVPKQICYKINITTFMQFGCHAMVNCFKCQLQKMRQKKNFKSTANNNTEKHRDMFIRYFQKCFPSKNSQMTFWHCFIFLFYCYFYFIFRFFLLFFL